MGTKSAQKSYEDFLALWKDADPDIPIYRQAKTEYAQLRKGAGEGLMSSVAAATAKGD